MKRNYLSGAQKRKLAEEKIKKTEEEVKKLPKLTSFFSSTASATSSQNAISTPSSDFIETTEINSKTLKDEKNDFLETIQSDTANCDKNNQSDDPGTWKEFNTDDIAYWIEIGPDICQHHEGPFENSLRMFNNGNQKRFCSQQIFSGTKANGETYKREWLLYSQSTGSVYCFVCKLFASKTASSRFIEGFSDWRNIIVVDQHENSSNHRDSMLNYLIRRQGRFTLTSKLEYQINSEREYWRNVLQRVVAVIKTLAERGMPFRGSNEKFGSSHNENFIGLLELLAQFDPFLAGHISKYGHCGKGNANYLSKTICDELINLMAEEVLLTILEEVKTAGYYSLSVDSTPDVAHVDQLSIVLRYVSFADGLPVERFFTFLNLKSHKGQEMADQVFSYLTEVCKLDFSKCRGQSYGNAANMCGCYSGMQSKILEINKYAIFIPCAGHSLNLVGRNAVDCCPIAVDFFSMEQLLYNFFSSSPQRWAILKKYLDKDHNTLKNLSDTRWEAHAIATEAILKSYPNIIKALESINEDDFQKGETKQQAQNIANKMQELEFVFMLNMWNEILQMFHRTSQSLQSEELDLQVCADLYESVSEYLHTLRDDFERLEITSKNMLPDVDYKSRSRRQLRKKQVIDGTALDIVLNARDKFRISTFYVIIDNLKAQMKRRSAIYSEVSNRFSFLIDLDLSKEDYLQKSKCLVGSYSDDLDMNLKDELQQFHCYMRSKIIENEHLKVAFSDFYTTILNDRIQSVFPNVEIAMRIFLTLMITNCSAERSFSQLKRIKNPLRSNMCQERLDSLCILCIESDILRRTSFDDLVKKFAERKCRRKLF